MSAPALGEFRSLLALFRQSDLRDLSVRARDWSVFFAKPGGAPSPVSQPTPSSPAPTAVHTATAPHLGVVAHLLPVATPIAAGTPIAEIAVLDERRAVLADRAGTVAAHLAQVGGLVEFGHGLVEIA